MKKTLCLVLGLIAFTFSSPASAGEKTFPAKNPVLSFIVPENWKTEVDPKDGSISVNSPDGRISVNFAEVPVEASMEIFEKMLPDMVKALGEGAAVADKPKEHSEDGLTGYTATYAAKIEGKPAIAIMVLFKGGKDRAVLGNVIVSDPATLTKEGNEAFEGVMKSLKAAGK